MNKLQSFLSKSLSQVEWDLFFKNADMGIIPDWLPSKDSSSEEPKLTPLVSSQDLAVLSPVHATERVGLFDRFPTLSYDEDSSLDDDDDGQSPRQDFTMTDVRQTPQDFKNRFASIKTKWTKTFQELEGNHLLITSDISKLSDVTRRLVQEIGSPGSIPISEDCNICSIWQALQVLSTTARQHFHSTHDTLAGIVSNSEVLSQGVEDLQQEFLSFTQTIKQVQDTQVHHESRFSKILPILRGITGNAPVSKTSNAEIRHLDEKIQELGSMITKIQDSAWRMDLAPTSTTSSIQVMDREIRDLKGQLQTLQLRIVGSGV